MDPSEFGDEEQDKESTAQQTSTTLNTDSSLEDDEVTELCYYTKITCSAI